MDSPAAGNVGWARARAPLKRMSPSDWILATLPGNRAGRLGSIVGLEVADECWNPIVPRSDRYPSGENGRRILVRWELSSGPDDPGKVVLLPSSVRFNSGELQGTVREVPIEKLEKIREAMREESNWVGLSNTFRHETALSDYLAVHPHRLEGGMISHPSEQVRERAYPDRTRSDVILQDRHGKIVLVECKQWSPTERDVDQLMRYRKWLFKEMPTFGFARAMLVHGGSKRVPIDVSKHAEKNQVELVHHDLRVDFSASS